MESIFGNILNLRELIINFFAPYFGWIKLFSLVLSGVLLWGIFWCMGQLTFINSKIEQYMDMLNFGNLAKHRSIRGWKQIKTRLRSGDEANLKSAIIEADYILDELLKISGYQGKDMDERLNGVESSQLSNISDIWSAHKIKHRLKEKDFHINKQETELIINIYKKAFQEFGLLD